MNAITFRYKYRNKQKEWQRMNVFCLGYIIYSPLSDSRNYRLMCVLELCVVKTTFEVSLWLSLT